MKRIGAAIILLWKRFIDREAPSRRWSGLESKGIDNNDEPAKKLGKISGKIVRRRKRRRDSAKSRQTNIRNARWRG